MTTTRSGRPYARAAGGWGVIGAIGAMSWFISYSIVSIIVAIGAGLVAGGLAAVDAHQNGGRLLRPKVVASTKGYQSRAYRSRKQRQADRRAAINRGQVQTGTTRMAGRTCSGRCRQSKMPRWSCRCVCGGQHHGADSGLAAVTRIASEVLTPAVSRRPAAPRGRQVGPRKKASPAKPKTAGQAQPKPTREPAIPAGEPDMPLMVIWRRNDGKTVRVQSTKATAQILQTRGQLIRTEPIGQPAAK
jgi:hypothetical protein